MKTAKQHRQMLRSALVSSTDSLARAQAGLEADEEVRAAGGLAAFAGVGPHGGNAISGVLERCTAAENATVEARELLDRPLTPAWFRSEVQRESGSSTAGSDEEKQAVEAAQRATTEAEGAAAHLMERLAQIRGIRAKLRSLLADVETRFRRATAVLADAGVSSGNEDIDGAGKMASVALNDARDRLRSPLVSGYFVTDGGLVKDEDAVSEAQGYVKALEVFVKTAVDANANKREVRGGPWLKHVAGAPAVWTMPISTDGAGNAQIAASGGDELALAVKWGEALRTHVSDLGLGDDPTVSQSIEAVGNAMLTAEKLWSSRNSGEEAGGDSAQRAAVEELAGLRKLGEVAEDTAERRRVREAGLGAAARRLDRLFAILKSVEETVKSAGEPSLSLTSDAMRAAWDAINAAAAASPVASTFPSGMVVSVRDTERRAAPHSSESAAFIDAVQEAAVAVAQVEVTANRARERASQVSAERVRILKNLIRFAETLSQVGDRAAATSHERGLSYSREAAAAISEAQAALSRARTAAQADVGSWVSGAAAIAEAVSKAGDLVRVAERTADGPAVVRPMTPGRNASIAGFATDEAVDEAEAKETGEKIRGQVEQDKIPSSARSGKATTGSAQRPRRIGFSSKGEGAPTYSPLWMRLQEKVWEASELVMDVTADKGGDRLEVEEENGPTAAAVSSAR